MPSTPLLVLPVPQVLAYNSIYLFGATTPTVRVATQYKPYTVSQPTMALEYPYLQVAPRNRGLL